MPPIKGKQKKLQYPEQYKNPTGKELWSGKDNEVSAGHSDVWRNITDEISIILAVTYSHKWFWHWVNSQITNFFSGTIWELLIFNINIAWQFWVTTIFIWVGKGLINPLTFHHI